MGKLVCSGATLQCSFGLNPATFTASGQKASATAPTGVVTDISSIPSFGACTALQGPCVPVVTDPWTPGSAHVTIGGVAALDDASHCMCKWQGQIMVSSPGQEQAAAG
jgi:Domain of unknown function (DUF4280)